MEIYISIIAFCVILIIFRLKKSNLYKFGSYKGKKIDWIILERNDNKILLISHKFIDGKHFSRGTDSSESSNKWSSSDIRYWLNQEFLNEAFSSEEQKLILETKIVTKGCSDTKDKIFLLSQSEALHYFDTNSKRLCTLLINGKNLNPNDECCWWWLRSPGKTTEFQEWVTAVNNTGEIVGLGRNKMCDFLCLPHEKYNIRPALWLSLEKKDSSAIKN